MRNVLLYALIAFSTLNLFAQDTDLALEKGVVPHKGIDAVYAEFSEAYKSLTPRRLPPFIRRTLHIFRLTAIFLPAAKLSAPTSKVSSIG